MNRDKSLYNETRIRHWIEGRNIRNLIHELSAIWIKQTMWGLITGFYRNNCYCRVWKPHDTFDRCSSSVTFLINPYSSFVIQFRLFLHNIVSMIRNYFTWPTLILGNEAENVWKRKNELLRIKKIYE